MAPSFNPDTLRQLAATGSDFYRQALADFSRHGALTAEQVAALAERPLAAALPQPANVPDLEAAFARARAAGIQKPRIKLAGFMFKSAPTNGKNPGAVYVCDEDATYLGKVMNNRFSISRDCSPTMEREVLLALADPVRAAELYGKRFGCCAICSRTLTDPESVTRGIGPICAGRFGW